MRSDTVKKGFERAPHRSLLKATGVTDADMGKPLIAVCNSFDNALALDMAMGGSTNTILHALAVAHEAGVSLGLARIDAISRMTPTLCKVAPSSSYHMEDVDRAAPRSATSPPRRPRGAIALVRDGDRIRLDIPQRKLELVVSDAELNERHAKWRLPPKGKAVGCLGKYASMAASASTGAILKW